MNKNTFNTVSSSVLSKVEKRQDKQTVLFNKGALGFVVLIVSASLSTNVTYDNVAPLTPSTVITYQSVSKYTSDVNVFHNFISNLLINSENIDSDIVDLVNENFWDLI